MTYEKSNNVIAVKYTALSKKEYATLLSVSDTAAARQKASQAVLNYLCDKYGIPRATVTVRNAKQPHRTGRENGRLASKTFGNYRVFSHTITIFNLTAVRGNIVAIKTFADTLLHEFMHHYDMQFLHFAETPHTAGFYKRISDLKNKLGN
jgi:hypothetical protein